MNPLRPPTRPAHRCLSLLGVALSSSLGLWAAGCGSSSGSSSSGSVTNSIALSPATGATLTDATQFALYRQTFSVAAGGTAPYGFYEQTGGLPEGLFMVMHDGAGRLLTESSTGELVGFPQAAGTSSLTFRVYDVDNEITDPTYTLTTVAAAGGGLSFSPSSGARLADGTLGATYGPVTLTVSGGTADYAWRLVYGSLPPGLTFTQNPSGSDTTTAQISGTPTTAGSFILGLEASDAASPAGAGGALYQIRVQ